MHGLASSFDHLKENGLEEGEETKGGQKKDHVVIE